MREHGVLRRALLCYDELSRRLRAGEAPSAPLAGTAALIRRFVEDYHERLEETELFPRLRAQKTLAPLVDTLYAQHRAGRDVAAQGADADARDVEQLLVDAGREGRGADHDDDD